MLINTVSKINGINTIKFYPVVSKKAIHTLTKTEKIYLYIIHNKGVGFTRNGVNFVETYPAALPVLRRESQRGRFKNKMLLYVLRSAGYYRR